MASLAPLSLASVASIDGAGFPVASAGFWFPVEQQTYIYRFRSAYSISTAAKRIVVTAPNPNCCGRVSTIGRSPQPSCPRGPRDAQVLSLGSWQGPITPTPSRRVAAHQLSPTRVRNSLAGVGLPRVPIILTVPLTQRKRDSAWLNAVTCPNARECTASNDKVAGEPLRLRDMGVTLQCTQWCYAYTPSLRIWQDAVFIFRRDRDSRLEVLTCHRNRWRSERTQPLTRA